MTRLAGAYRSDLIALAFLNRRHLMARDNLRLQLLGTGGGASHVYAGECSTAFLLSLNGRPRALIDIGLGVTRACLQVAGRVPDDIIVTHNHTDHAGELPVVLRYETSRDRRLRVLAEREVAERLRHHRLSEHREQMSADELAEWLMPDPGERVALSADLTLTFHVGRHSERCCGLLLYYKDEPVLGYTGDSEADAALYAALEPARFRVLDARPAPAQWHATFDEVRPSLRDGDRIVGHGLAREHAPLDLPLLFAGDELQLV